MSEPNDEFEYGLVMPFVAVASKGGPYDDAAYVAGYEMGLLDAHLEAVGEWVSSCAFTVNADNVEQADLIGMRHGFVTARAGSEEFPGWVQVTLSRTEVER